jgi:hypothetical protein
MFFILHVTKVSKLVLLKYFVEIYKIKNLMILMNLSINVFKQGVSISLGASSPRSINSTTCQMCRFNDNIATSCLKNR